MDQLNEYSKEVVDRFLRSMGYDPEHIDRNKRMAYTKTIRFKQFAQRMGDVHEELEEQTNDSSVMTNKPYTKGLAQSRAHSKDMSIKRSVHVNKPQLPVKTEETKASQLIKSIYKKNRVVKEELYDHEKDDKGGTTYGKKPKLNVAEPEDATGDKKTEAAAVLSGGTTLTGQKRDVVEIDPILKKGKPGSPNSDIGNTKQ